MKGLLIVLFPVAVFAGLFAILVWVEAVACHSKYSAYGETSYGPIQGCMIKRPDNKSIPSETIREEQ
jgi:hypothetical protein